MRLLSRERLDEYFNDCYSNIERHISSFKSEKYDDSRTFENAIRQEIRQFDYCFPFKYIRILSYSNYQFDMELIEDSLDEIFFLDIATKYFVHIRHCLNNMPYLIKLAENSLYDDSDGILVDSYIYERLSELEKQANFEWSLSDKSSTDMFNSVFIFITIAEPLLSFCNLPELKYELAESRESLLERVQRLENNII